MPLVRMLVSWAPPAYPVKDRFSNTLYFNVSGSVEDPDYQGLADDLRDIYLAGPSFTVGCEVQVRAYNMADAKPRPERAYAEGQRSGTFVIGAGQVALCLSYYADRNLPRQRGRIYCGPYTPSTPQAGAQAMGDLINFGKAFAGLGGLNVDWSVYSPTTSDARRISNIWVDNSWDIVRSRKIDATARAVDTVNG